MPKFEIRDRVEVLPPSKGADKWTGRVLNVVEVCERQRVGVVQDYGLAWHPDGEGDVFIAEQRLKKVG